MLMKRMIAGYAKPVQRNGIIRNPIIRNYRLAKILFIL